jgi:hypothetical protein
MGYGVRHLDGSIDEDAPTSSFRSLYDELRRADGEHNDAAVIDDDTGWCVTAYPSGLVIFQCLADGSAFHCRDVIEDDVIRMWTELANGRFEDLRRWPWKDGFK